MAFTYCTNCGKKIDDSVEKCPYCGQPKGADRVYGYEDENFGRGAGADGGSDRGGNPWESGNSYGQQGQNPYGNNGSPYGQQGQNPYGNNGNPYGQQRQNPYGGNPWEGGQGPYGGGYGQNGGPWQPREKRKLSVGLLVFSIINILLGTCCAGSIFGIIGLVFCITARDAVSEEEEIRRKKISLAINIIAVALTVVFIVSFAVGFVNGGGLEIFAALSEGAA